MVKLSSGQILFQVAEIPKFCFCNNELNSVSFQFLVASEFLQSFKTSPLVWQIEWFKDVREGCIPATYTLNGCFKRKETIFLQNRKNTSMLVM